MKLTKMAIMKLGTHKAMDGREISFTADMLNDIAASYDPQLSEAPIVIGHPKLTAPSYGWVKQASIEGDTLYAHVGQVEAAFADAVNEGRYKKRSASIFLPDSPGNPKPGHYYLNHIGFLGAAPPAVKGLGDVNFAASDAENAFAEFSFDIESINRQPQEKPMDKTPEEIA
ncbi:peptidase, partial [Pasteurella multocida]|nr:peptidase [Pasteurella multocida]